MISDQEDKSTTLTRTVFITGATGLIGSHLLKALTRQGKKVKALYRAQKGFEHPCVEWVRGDISDILLLEEAMQDVQQVYHCAALVSFNPKQKKELLKTNVDGTANVVNACLENNVQKLLHVSSVSALGRLRNSAMIDESMQWSEETNNSTYGESKYLAEMEVWRGIAEGLNAVIINPTIVLGSGDWNKGSSEIFEKVYNEFPYYSEGVTGFVDVDDVVNAMITLMESNISADRFIVSAENVSYKTLFEMIAAAFNKKPPQKKITPFMASAVWRFAAIKSLFSADAPFITKETARTALIKAHFDNRKLLEAVPSFRYTPLRESVQRIANEFKLMHNLQ
ncbi:MAG TPA: NAD-dependent epimerase/dehydratase family protein [Parafilimonas sp.]|nr:NAD-dependent epimerase/dehydratase family protein [Parafilimonas sp.]